jgi:hypothetical protein
MNENRRINIKNNSKLLLVRKKDLMSIISKKVQKSRREVLDKQRLVPCKQIGLEILSKAMSDYYSEESSSSNNNNSNGAMTVEFESQHHNDSLVSGTTEKDVDSLSDHVDKNMKSPPENDYENKNSFNENRKIFDETELIDILGLETYLEIMCNIEEEINYETNYKNNDINTEINCEYMNFDDDEFIDTLESEQLICPNCR